jgi:hypothetical protein
VTTPILPASSAEKTINPGIGVQVKTEAESYPPIKAFSDTATAAISGTNYGTASGDGVFGTSKAGDGVHGEASQPNFSAVCGIHTGGGKAVYGKSTGNAGYFDGNVEVVGKLTVQGDIVLPGADCAESFDLVKGASVAPGTLVVIDQDGALTQSEHAYDRKVAGVVAGAGEYRPAIILDTGGTGKSRASVSLIGKAFCKVDADFGAIEVGDLLTSSHTSGHAMKAADPSRAFGAIVGKALRPLASGRGMIPILIALQ